jgi:hypothetical protein
MESASSPSPTMQPVSPVVSNFTQLSPHHFDVLSTSRQVFSSLALFNQLRFPLLFYPFVKAADHLFNLRLFFLKNHAEVFCSG